MHHCIGTLGAFRACKQTLALHFMSFFRCLFCPIEETALSSIRACTRAKGTAPRPHLAIESLTLWRGEPMYLHMMAEQRRTLRRQLLCHCCEANALTTCSHHLHQPISRSRTPDNSSTASVVFVFFFCPCRSFVCRAVC